jgi:hypothetical protein
MHAKASAPLPPPFVQKVVTLKFSRIIVNFIACLGVKESSQRKIGRKSNGLKLVSFPNELVIT